MIREDLPGSSVVTVASVPHDERAAEIAAWSPVSAVQTASDSGSSCSTRSPRTDRRSLQATGVLRTVGGDPVQSGPSTSTTRMMTGPSPGKPNGTWMRPCDGFG